MKKPRLYVAYGSNLNKRQMSYRCPGAKVITTGIIENHRLVYRGSKTGAYATIIPCEGESVQVAIWQINKTHEIALDRYEGFPSFYYKKMINVKAFNGYNFEAMVYIMRDDAPVGRPSEYYLDVCAEGYLDCGLDMTKFEESIVYNKQELECLCLGHISA